MQYDRELSFDWDPEKDVTNRLKHGISFETAARVFRVPDRYIEETTKPEHGERRWKAVGTVAGEPICVIYTERNDDLRIFSARAARRGERRELGSRQDAE
jgi:uncharacterized DUF497 family protein